MEDLVKISNLDFGYKKGQLLFNNLSLNVSRGHIYGLFGKNGTGKTSLLKQITGLLFPQGGSCHIYDKPAKERLPSVLQNLFVIPEEFVLPAIRIKEYEEVHAGFYPGYNPKEFENHLHEFGIERNDNLGKLSYGQRKKFLISFGLATNVPLLLMDEPTNGLDIPSKSQFRKIMAGNISDEQAVFISTHQVRDLASLIDKVIILENGKIIFNENIREISDKLSFSKAKEVPADTLYSEEAFGGYHVIRPIDQEETETDLELLFNGVLQNPETINQIFKNS